MEKKKRDWKKYLFPFVLVGWLPRINEQCVNFVAVSYIWNYLWNVGEIYRIVNLIFRRFKNSDLSVVEFLV